jgi:Fic family protein
MAKCGTLNQRNSLIAGIIEMANNTAKNTAEKEHPALMEPMLPAEGVRNLEDLAIELVAKANTLAGHVNPVVQHSMGTLVRSMNCYYSNLIEGHDTRPRDIDRALSQDYVNEPKRRALQLEAVAHIEVQRKIDEGEDINAEPTSVTYISWLHREFCSRLPEELLWAEDPDTKLKVRVEPGVLRNTEVVVGRHLPPNVAALPDFLRRFEESYSQNALSKLRQIIGVAAAHHRLLWIHPFVDGNGRVARLMSHTALKRLSIGSSLWSISRGLARNVTQYKKLLMAADESRRSDLDGRGNLSQAALTEFCEFFLRIAVDQVEFMESLLEPRELLRRIQLYVEDEVRARRLHEGSYAVLREALLAGNVDRATARALTGYQERMGRTIILRLIDTGLLISEGSKSPLRLGFPLDVVERWFPKLYPVG